MNLLTGVLLILTILVTTILYKSFFSEMSHFRAISYGGHLVLLLTLVPFIHELGHFSVARLYGYEVTAFTLTSVDIAGLTPESPGFGVILFAGVFFAFCFAHILLFMSAYVQGHYRLNLYLVSVLAGFGVLVDLIPHNLLNGIANDGLNLILIPSVPAGTMIVSAIFLFALLCLHFSYRYGKLRKAAITQGILTPKG